DRRRRQRLTRSERDMPATTRRGLEPPRPHPEPELHTAPPGLLHEPVADVAGPVGDWKELPGFRLEPERHTERVLEEVPLAGERPRPQQLGEGPRRRRRDKASLVERRGENVAASSAADQDFPSAIGGALEHEHRSVA